MLEINGCRIEAYPSHNLSSFRSLTNPKFIFLDEADHFPIGHQDEVRHTAERYIAKSDPFIVMVSTPNQPNGLFERIEKEPIETCIYKKMFLDWTYGVGKIYTTEEIENAKRSPSWLREYCLAYISTSGNIFSQGSIDRAVGLGNKYPIIPNKMAKHSCGVDPGFGSSSFGICVLEHSDDIIKVVYADQFERSSFNDMVQKIWELRNTVGNLTNIYIDGANTEFIEAVKQDIGEDSNWHHIHDKIVWAKKNKLDISDYMVCVPVSFGVEGASMLSHCKNLLEHEDSLVAINSKYDKLIAGLRGARAQEYKLNKNETPYSDLVDAYRLAMKFFRVKK